MKSRLEGRRVYIEVWYGTNSIGLSKLLVRSSGGSVVTGALATAIIADGRGSQKEASCERQGMSS
jgi:hypothetical protein